ncbi:MAG: HlyD family efflux transporter periplasmic adaptor subunit [Oscillospiraceae bacterium]|nr:HlyD family efflux transporter periplasmic adaptor subunit [Oscillospiraceae bacterium]
MEKAKKKRIKKVISWISMALVVALLAAMPLIAQQEAEADGPVASILSGSVQMGSLTASLRGGGTLTAQKGETVELPDGVKITELLVKNGESVTEGQPLATVDKVSVMTAIVQVQDTLSALQKDMADVRKQTVSSTISATAGGRVKAVYAKAGDSVQDIMLKHGALAILSLDGLMAVELDTAAPLATGDSVKLAFSDGETVAGRVESNLDGHLVVTLEDEGYAIGESVTVTTEDGQMLGIAPLYVHNAWKATAVSGTVSAVRAVEERTVYAGGALFTLKDTEFPAQLEALSGQHRDYEALMQRLFQMYESGTLNAPCDGQVSGVDKDSPHLLSGEETPWEARPLAASENTGWTVMLLSAEETAPTEPEEETGTYTGFPGKVTHIGSTEIITIMSEVGGTVTKDEEGKWDFAQIDLNPEHMLHSGLAFTVENAAAFSIGDIIVVIYDENGDYTVEVAQKAQPEIPSIPGFPGGMGGMGSIDISGMLGGLMGGFSGFGGSAAAAQQTEQTLFPLEGNVLLTVTPQDTMSMTITLDEQDIASVSVGQTAEVKVEALRGQVFEAQVTSVSAKGTNGGGSSKFTVTLELPKSADMLDGMSAAASIPLYSRLDVLTIPVEALTETGAKTVVYTALDAETGDPTTPVEVSIGMSDGLHSEILSGLKLGDAFYYSYYDTLELDTSAEEARYSFG